MNRFVTFAVLASMASGGSAQSAVQPSNTPEGRAALAAFAGCIVKGSPDKVRVTLTRDFRTPEYRRDLRSLSDLNGDCLQDWKGSRESRRVVLRAGGLPFAAALAEAMIRRGNPAPLNVRLLRAAGKEMPTYAPSDRIAMCVARSDADHVAALLNAPIASDAESKAAQALGPAVRACGQGSNVILEPYGLRAILATASYRLLAAQGS